jgi:hypothetical protein
MGKQWEIQIPFCLHSSARSSKLEPLQQLRSTMLFPVSSGSVVFVRHQSVTPLPKLNEEPLPVPTPSGTKKDYAPKITGLVDQISGLTLIEVADLSELLKVLYLFSLSCVARGL